MSASIRNFDNFKDFDGSIKNEIYCFPKLYKTTLKGQKRQWQIFVRLIKKSSKNIKLTRSYNWNLMDEIQIPIKEEYLFDDAKIPDGVISQIWTESGTTTGKISRSPASYMEITNLGKSNERNFLHQALVEARSKYIKKNEQGSGSKKSNFKHLFDDKKWFPMLAKLYDDFKDKIKYPQFIQPKLNGLRCIIYYDPVIETKEPYEKVIMYSRDKKIYPFNENNIQIRETLLEIFKKYYDFDRKQSIYLDGELYTHGVSIQDINNARSSKNNPKSMICYYMYDIFYPYYNKEPFSDRYSLLENFYNDLNKLKNSKKIIRLTNTKLIDNEK